MYNVTSARDVARYEEQERQKKESESRHRRILEEGSLANQKSLKYLQEQVSMLEEQNKTLADGYEMANTESLKSKKSNRVTTLLSIISLVVAIASLVVAICK